jgi:hypothetical protein
MAERISPQHPPQATGGSIAPGLDAPKIVGVGFQKTGTSSLRDALRVLGYQVGDNNKQMLWPIVAGRWDRVWRKVARYHAVEDNPWPLIYRELDQQFPGSKFILTLRAEDHWYRSVKRHIGFTANPMHEWIYGRGQSVPAWHPDNTRAVYRRHNAAVRAYFRDRPGDLLVVDWTQGDAWPELCAFLGCAVPDVPFPHANREGSQPKASPSLPRRLKTIKQRVKYFFSIRYGRLRGFW